MAIEPIGHLATLFIHLFSMAYLNQVKFKDEDVDEPNWTERIEWCTNTSLSGTLIL